MVAAQGGAADLSVVEAGEAQVALAETGATEGELVAMVGRLQVSVEKNTRVTLQNSYNLRELASGVLQAFIFPPDHEVFRLLVAAKAEFQESSPESRNTDGGGRWFTGPAVLRVLVGAMTRGEPELLREMYPEL